MKCKSCLKECERKSNHQKYCGICKLKEKKEYIKEWRKKNREHIKKYAGGYYLQNKELSHQRTKEWRKKNPQKFVEHSLKHQRKYPKRRKAYARTSNDKIRGKHKLKGNFCQICDSKERLQFHHTNYEKDKGFTLCITCHNIIHKYQKLLEMEAKDKNIDLLRVKINKKENEEKKIY